MITAEEFAARWIHYGELVKFDEQQINDYSISKNTKDFLLVSGLPEAAAPFVAFCVPEDKHEISVDEKSIKSAYMQIGFTSHGSPICINETNENIVYLDHENNNQAIFINSSLAQFMESLLEYADFIEKIKKQNGRKAFLERNATRETLEYICHQLESIDCNALSYGNFWCEEMSHWQ